MPSFVALTFSQCGIFIVFLSSFTSFKPIFFKTLIRTFFANSTCFFVLGAILFFVMAIIIGIVARFSEKEIVDTFLEGAKDILGVILIIAVARGASVLMKTTNLDNYIITVHLIL